MRVGVGCAVGDGDSANSHDLMQPGLRAAGEVP
jgi:hypothetical protein